MVAHTIFEDLHMAKQFVCDAWVTIGSTTTYQIKLAQVDHDTSLHPDLIDEEVCNYLGQVLETEGGGISLKLITKSK